MKHDSHRLDEDPSSFDRCSECRHEFDGTEKRIWRQFVESGEYGNSDYGPGHGYRLVSENVMEDLLREEAEQREMMDAEREEGTGRVKLRRCVEVSLNDLKVDLNNVGPKGGRKVKKTKRGVSLLGRLRRMRW